MSKDDLRFLGAIGVFVVGCAVAFIGMTSGFDTPPQGGWFYQYQTLSGGVLALAGAILTVAFFSREQRHQAARFERQMEIALRRDKLLVMRETTRLIPIMRRYARNARVLSRVVTATIGTADDPRLKVSQTGMYSTPRRDQMPELYALLDGAFEEDWTYFELTDDLSMRRLSQIRMPADEDQVKEIAATFEAVASICDLIETRFQLLRTEYGGVPLGEQIVTDMLRDA